ncbi:DsbA family oxidoreductase [Paenibacillus glycinis]|uniref:Thioredoxin domain-containing protein n=1 Tax=Paenibacillus glycinis TaxID=2697035 RepID=A0ABW9XM64_9BACL|nr:DsbA family oxidoreductase [Paenibacillus glycinis]NBD23722.1 thioredoxin domain-containing protein [Paenibacillus glycinis]
MKDLTVDVYMDTSCPWCRMGTTSLLAAVEQLPPDAKATIRWHAFQINPGIRPEGEDYSRVMIGKLGGAAQFEARKKQYNQYGENYGLTYHMERVKYTPNTVLSHQLIAIAPEQLQAPLIQRIYAAYFEEGLDIGDADVLAAIGGEVLSTDASELKVRLTQGEGMDKVEAGQRDAEQLGIRGVPYYVINGKVSLSGLQPPDELMRWLVQSA